jgi:hypothetical protein
MPHSNRLSLSIASTAAMALASLPLSVTPASAARVSEGTTSSIGVVEAASNAQQFNLKTQVASTDLVARWAAILPPFRPKGKFVVPAFLQQLLQFFKTTPS